MKKIYIILLFLLCSLYPAELIAGDLVTAKGLSFFEPGREAIAREKALGEAKRAAIEKAIGTLIESRTEVKNFQLTFDQVLSHSTGYLGKINILEEKKSAFGTYEVTIEAEVEITDLIGDLDRFNKMLGWQKNLFVSIIIEPKMNQTFLPTANKIAGLITRKMERNGFRIFKHSTTGGIQMGLMVTLNLELSTVKSSFQGLNLSLNEISLSTTILRVGDEEILATASAVQKQPGDNRLQALDKGGIVCVNTIWEQLRSQLIKLWEKEIYNNRDIFLVIKNVPSHAKAQDIKYIFKSDVTGVLDVTLLNFADKKAQYNLKYKGWPEHLLNEIQMSYFKKKYFVYNLEKVEGNKITIKFK